MNTLLSISILFQFIAAILAMRLIRVTGKQLAWSLIAAAVFLMAIRRSVTLYSQVFAEPSQISSGDIGAELVALLISIFMLIGIASIKPLFISLKNSEQKIKESQENFFALAKNSSHGIFVNVEGRLAFANHQAANLLGYADAEILNVGAEQIYQADDNDEALLIDCGQPGSDNAAKIFETKFKRKDGSIIPVEVSAAQTKWDNHSAGIISFTDITQRKQDEETLAASKKMLRLVLDTIPVRVFWKSPEFKYLGCNQLFAQDAGLQSPEQIIGKSDYELSWREQAEYYRADDAYVIESGVSMLNHEELQTGSDGMQRWLRTSKIPIPLHGSAGSIIGVLGCYEDITEPKQIEDELKKYRENLEGQVNERTRELEIANEELESFSYSVSHDLRAPLRSINGFSNILLEGYESKLNSTGKSYLLRIIANTQHMDELIDDMLILSRVSRSEMRIESVDLSRLAHKIAAQLKENEPDRAAEFSIQKDLVEECDAHLMGIVIENLLGNAWKYTGKEKVSRIEFGLTSKNNLQVYYIRDNGAGFEMDYVGKIFDAFERLHSVSEFEGTGIGLATVKRIIQRHGGGIWAESEVNKGASFYFYLGKPPSSRVLNITSNIESQGS